MCMCDVCMLRGLRLHGLCFDGAHQNGGLSLQTMFLLVVTMLMNLTCDKAGIILFVK